MRSGGGWTTLNTTHKTAARMTELLALTAIWATSNHAGTGAWCLVTSVPVASGRARPRASAAASMHPVRKPGGLTAQLTRVPTDRSRSGNPR